MQSAQPARPKSADHLVWIWPESYRPIGQSAWLVAQKKIERELPVRDFRMTPRFSDMSFIRLAATAVLDARHDGPQKSKSISVKRPSDVIGEALWLGEQGVKELFLVSENSTSYGKDLGDLRLLETLLPELAAVDGVERVRVSYLQPAETRPALLDAIVGTEGVADYFDLDPEDVSVTYDWLGTYDLPAGCSVASNPEFLREGAAIEDFKRPDRIVIGIEDERARPVMEEVYRPLYLNQAPILFTGRRTSELIKYAANAFLAVKITFINEIADLCEAVDADVQDVARGIGLGFPRTASFQRPTSPVSSLSTSTSTGISSLSTAIGSIKGSIVSLSTSTSTATSSLSTSTSTAAP